MLKTDFKIQTENYFRRFKAEDTIAIIYSGFKTIQEITKVKDLNFSKLRAYNLRGFDIYSSVLTLKDTASHRREDDINDLQRFLWLDIDAQILKTCALKEWTEQFELPLPNLIVNTSLDKFHYYWILDKPIHKNNIKHYNINLKKYIEAKTGIKLDSVHDLSRVLRVPGFKNSKNGYIARLIRFNLNPVKTEEFDKITAPHVEQSSTKTNLNTVRPITKICFDDVSHRTAVIKNYKSKSEEDIAEVIYRLSHGYTEQEVKDYLRDKRRGEKHDLEYYVNITVAKALDYLERCKIS